jgi:hypothetical protein
MSDEHIERTLRSVPTKTLSARADSQILAALCAAAGSRRAWYAKPIPLWQTAAACLVVSAATWLSTGLSGTSERAPGDVDTVVRPKAVFVRLDEPLFSQGRLEADGADISHWQSLNNR